MSSYTIQNRVPSIYNDIEMEREGQDGRQSTGWMDGWMVYQGSAWQGCELIHAFKV